MKVYRAKRNIAFDNPLFRTIREGECVYEEMDNLLNSNLGLRPSYLQRVGYPLRAQDVEDRPDDFEQLPGSDKLPDYYIRPVYTQDEMDAKLKEAYKIGVSHGTGPNEQEHSLTKQISTT